MRRVMFISLCASLGACQPSPETARKDIPSAADPTAGPQATPALVASALFRDICVDTYPSFQGAYAEIAKAPFVLSQSSQIYYHRQLDLSFKLSEDPSDPVCSIVFGSEDAEEDAHDLLALAVSGLTTLNVYPTNSMEGRNYYGGFIRPESQSER